MRKATACSARGDAKSPLVQDFVNFFRKLLSPIQAFKTPERVLTQRVQEQLIGPQNGRIFGSDVKLAWTWEPIRTGGAGS